MRYLHCPARAECPCGAWIVVDAAQDKLEAVLADWTQRHAECSGDPDPA